MARPVAVSVEKPQALSGTISGVMPRRLKARPRLRPCQSLPSPNMTMAASLTASARMDRQANERDNTASSMRPAWKLSPVLSDVTVTIAGLNNMRSIA